ncbi:MAG: 50S ribosomal protein L15 [Paludibacteraceae bacterium]|nr:50S ribosomal protein L15 [Paludibacteraceae bacterium]
MNLNNLTPAAGSVKSSKRIGRGPGSGKGGTSTRGHKGAKSRSGYSRKIGFEGGQMPLQRRLPKFGFKNMNRIEYKPINLATLQELADKLSIDTINVDTLVNAGFLSKNNKVKILGNGELKSKLLVEAHAFSNSAKAAIEALGGEAKTL